MIPSVFFDGFKRGVNFCEEARTDKSIQDLMFAQKRRLVIAGYPSRSSPGSRKLTFADSLAAPLRACGALCTSCTARTHRVVGLFRLAFHSSPVRASTAKQVSHVTIRRSILLPSIILFSVCLVVVFFLSTLKPVLTNSSCIMLSYVASVDDPGSSAFTMANIVFPWRTSVCCIG